MTLRERSAAAPALVIGAFVVLAASCTSGSRPPSDTTLPRPSNDAEVDAASSVADGAGGTPPAEGSAGDGAVSDSGTAEVGLPRDAASEGNGPVLDATLVAEASADGSAPAPEAAAGDAALAPPQCDPARQWLPRGRVMSIAQTNFGRFGGVSSDELSVAWTTTAGTIFVADRATRSGDFSAPAVVPTGSVAVATDRVALGPTRLKIYVVLADRSGFAAFDRPMVGAAWAESASMQFAVIRTMAATDAGGKFSEPILGADDASFFYLLTPLAGAPQLFESTWDPAAHQWLAGVALPNPDFVGTTTQRRRATGASFDGRTLFFFDESTSSERAAWRGAPGAPFNQFLDVTAYPEAAPNYRCDTLYYQGSDNGGAGVFLAF